MSNVATVVEAKQEFPYFTEEHDMIRQTVKRFCREEIAPYAEEWDLAGIFPKELFKKAANLGLFGIRIDPEWGGLGLDWWASAAYMEGMAHSDSGSVNMALMVQSEITLPALAELGTREQKDEFLRPAVAGDLIAALGISEPAADRTLRHSRHAPASMATIWSFQVKNFGSLRHSRGLHRPGSANRGRGPQGRIAGSVSNQDQGFHGWKKVEEGRQHGVRYG